MDLGILGELERFKLPALAQVPGVKVGRPVVVLVSRSGFTSGLVEAARRQERIILVDPETMAQLPGLPPGSASGPDRRPDGPPGAHTPQRG